MDAAGSRSLASSGDPLTDDALSVLIARHGEFLASGGGGGGWELLSASGLPLCVYLGAATEGAQLKLTYFHVARGAQMRGRNLSWADLSAFLAEGVDFSGTTLDGSVAVDSFFAGADFSHCSLRGVDFSGADLAGARFVGADLTGADFEQADCTGADFTGANIEHARFPGAVLDNVVRDSGPRQPFRERIEAMVAELRGDPRVEVFDVVIRPPASAADLDAAERAFGARLPPALRAFYAAHDGVFVQWGLKDGEYEVTPPFGFPDYGTPPGSINLLPIGRVWSREGHADAIVDPDRLVQMFGKVPDPAPPVAAVVVDNYSMYRRGELVLGGDEGGLVLAATDHGADLEASDLVDVDTYLDAVTALWGLCRYEDALGTGWTRESKRLRTWSRRLTLDQVLERLRQGED